MRIPRHAIVTAVVFLLLASPCLSASPPQNATGIDRLFLGFAEDAAFTRSQWWEGQAEFADGSPTDATLARLVVAFQPYAGLEIGGRVGFGSTDAPSTLTDGSGATDLDVWGKWYLGTVQNNTDFAVGGLATVPTGDDTAGLGFDAFNFAVFGSARHRLSWGQFSAHAGLRRNGDGMIQGATLDGKTSAFLGAAIVAPLSDPVMFVGELRMESERFDGADTDTRLLGGINWRPFNSGTIRGAISVGITDGAPDAQVIAGYAHTF